MSLTFQLDKSLVSRVAEAGGVHTILPRVQRFMPPLADEECS